MAPRVKSSTHSLPQAGNAVDGSFILPFYCGLVEGKRNDVLGENQGVDEDQSISEDFPNGSCE